MATRLDLHEKLCTVLGSRNVYFQPPSSVKLVYPCIVYQLNKHDIRYADNSHYNRFEKYTVTVIDRDPDSDIPESILQLPLCSMNRVYTADNLNHFVFDLYY